MPHLICLKIYFEQLFSNGSKTAPEIRLTCNRPFKGQEHQARVDNNEEYSRLTPKV